MGSREGATADSHSNSKRCSPCLCQSHDDNKKLPLTKLSQATGSVPAHTKLVKRPVLALLMQAACVPWSADYLGRVQNGRCSASKLQIMQTQDLIATCQLFVHNISRMVA